MINIQPHRAFALIRQHGGLRVSLVGAAGFALVSLILVAALHGLAGRQLGGLGVVSSLLVPFALGLPILVAMTALVERLAVSQSELLRLARFDATTGAYNRRYLIECAESLCEHARMTGGAVSLILLDADLFKQTNDEFGHPAGDAVLRRLVRIIHALCEPGEVHGRYGGEEFALFLPGLTLEQAGRRAEQIRCAIAVGEVNFRGQIVKSTVSIGVACCSGAEASVARLVARADTALYAAKRGGRNRTELALSA